jgi:hypothetical protein
VTFFSDALVNLLNIELYCKAYELYDKIRDLVNPANFSMVIFSFYNNMRALTTLVDEIPQLLKDSNW